MRYCHSCNAQLPDSFARCVHCGGPLRSQPGASQRAARSRGSLDGLCFLARRHPSRARPLLEALREAGIHFVPVGDGGARRVDVPSGSHGEHARLDVYVLPDDLERASAIEQRVLRSSLPSLPPDYEPAAEPGDRCPACGTRLSGAPDVCGDCGLHFPD